MMKAFDWLMRGAFEWLMRFVSSPDPQTIRKPAKKRTIPHFPFPPLIFKGFPLIKNLGSFGESSGRNYIYQKIVDFHNFHNSVFVAFVAIVALWHCGIVAFVAFVDIVDIVDFADYLWKVCVATV
jgi:hypothetical protein